MKHRDRETSSGASIIPNYSFDDGWGGVQLLNAAGHGRKIKAQMYLWRNNSYNQHPASRLSLPPLGTHPGPACSVQAALAPTPGQRQMQSRGAFRPAARRGEVADLSLQVPRVPGAVQSTGGNASCPKGKPEADRRMARGDALKLRRFSQIFL